MRSRANKRYPEGGGSDLRDLGLESRLFPPEIPQVGCRAVRFESNEVVMSSPSTLASLVCRMVLLCLLARAASAAERNVDWPNVFNDKEGTRYSMLDQINRENVKDL